MSLYEANQVQRKEVRGSPSLGDTPVWRGGHEVPFMQGPRAVQPPRLCMYGIATLCAFLYHVFRNKTGLPMVVTKSRGRWSQQLQKDGVSAARAPRVDGAHGLRGG